MKNVMCTRCHQRPAVIFMSRYENGKLVNEGLCLQCARELGIPQVRELIDKMGISDEEMEAMSSQFMEMMGDEDGFSHDEYVWRRAAAGGGRADARRPGKGARHSRQKAG